MSLTDDIDCNPSEIPLPIWNPTPGGSDSPVGLPGGTIENPDNGANPNPGSSGNYGGYGSFTGGGGNGGNDLSFVIQFICNGFLLNGSSCGFTTSTVSGMSSHNTGGAGWSAIISFSRMSNQTNNQPTITNDPCNPSNDVGVLPPPEKTPCEELNKFNDNNTIQQSLQILKTQSTGVAERGNYISEITNSSGANYLSFPIIPQDPKNPNLLYIAGGLSTGKVKGAMHCHTNPSTTGMVPMFSAPDLEALYQIAYAHVPINNAEKDYAEYTVMLSVGSGHYALKLKNFSGNYAKFNTNIINFQKKLEKENEKLTSMAVSTDLVITFLKNINEFFGDEVGLFKATETIDANGLPKISGWKEQTLNENGYIIEIDCQ